MNRRGPALAVVALLGLAAGLLAGCSGGSGPAEDQAPVESASLGPVQRGVHVSAYVTPWDGRSRASWSAGADRVLTGVSPVWFTPAPDGGLVRQAPGPTTAVVSKARSAGTPVLPSVSNYVGNRWDGPLVAGIVGDPVRRARQVQAIAGAVRDNGWQGFDVDYEDVPTSARAAFSRFVSELGSALRAEHAVLTVTVQAKTSDVADGPGSAQNWAAIGRGADRVRVMAYDHAWSTSPPGPVAPLPWVRQVLAYAVSRIPRQKVELGIGTYGYDWTGSNGTSVTWQDAVDLARRKGVDPHWDGSSASCWFSYTDGGARHVVWFENARSAQLAVAAARDHGVDHVVLWELAGADPRIWYVLRR